MNFSKIKNYKDYSFLIIPKLKEHHKKGFSVSLPKLLFMIALYSIVLFIIFYFFSMLLPREKISYNKSEIEALNKKVIYLSKELDNITSLNKKLKNAIMLGDSELEDSIRKERKEKDKQKIGGNLLLVLSALFEHSDSTRREICVSFIRPCKGYISRNYNTDRGHFGIDYSAKTGTPVIAAESGYVLFADYTSADGYIIMIMHSNNYISVYKHCSELTKKVRDNVIQGETIALSGNTGYNSEGPHLHFEVWYNGQVINPNKVLIN